MRPTDLRTLPAESTVAADVCIVGGGPVGLTLARELDGSGLKIVLLESGGTERDGWAESLDRIVSVGTRRELDSGAVRNRALGGTSATWGGRIAKLEDIDFRQRDWVPDSGWPISLSTLEPYYLRAARHLNLTVADANHPGIQQQVARNIPQPPGDALRPFLWSYSMHPSLRPDFLRFGPGVLEASLADVHCFTHATVTHIDTDADGRVVDRVEVTGPDLLRRWISAPQVVLCAGGLENARLLLASNRVMPGGLGNQHDLVGRFLMDHPRGEVARFPRGAEDPAQRLLGDFVLRASQLPAETLVPGPRRPTWLTPGYALGIHLQEREELLNCAMFLTPELAEDDPLAALLSLAGREDVARNSRHVMANLALSADLLPRLMRGRYPVRRLSGLYAQCIVEQRPDRESRITLANELDAAGTPRARVDWRISEQEARTVRRTTELFIAETVRLGLPTAVADPMLGDDREFFLPDVAHPSGTTRMSADPRDGVVDANCAVHGVQGLHAVGSSVFPTNGHANPTYTAVALAVRLSDHLKMQIRSRRRADNPAPVPAPSTAATVPPRQRVGVTGAHGYVGGEIVRALEQAGHEVIALSRRPDGTHEHRAYDLTAPIPPGSLEGIDVVIHCAYAWEPSAWADIVRVNVDSTQRLLQATAEVRARFILISSVSAFAGTKQRYGNAKLLSEQLTLDAGGVVVRLGTVHGGANGGLYGLLRRLARLPVIPVFAPASRQSLIDVDTLGTALVKLVETPEVAGELVGLTNPGSISFRDLMRQLAHAEGKRPLILPLPWRPLYLVLRGIERLGVTVPVGSETILGLAQPAPQLASAELWHTLGVALDPPQSSLELSPAEVLDDPSAQEHERSAVQRLRT